MTITLLGKAIESGEHAFGLTPKVGQDLYFTGSSTAGARVTIVRGFGFPRSAESAYCTTLCKAIQWFQFGAFVDFAHINKEWFCMSTLTISLRSSPHVFAHCHIPPEWEMILFALSIQPLTTAFLGVEECLPNHHFVPESMLF
jgi:hypothetical protein